MEFKAELQGSLDMQGGGHGRIYKCTVFPGNVSCVAKPVDHMESKAYPLLAKTPLKDYIPKFYGIHNFEGKDFIVIEDLVDGFKSPSMADLKVGTRHWDLTASKEKVDGLIEKAKDSTTNTLGVRVIDVKMRRNKTVVKAWDRKQGLVLTEEQFKDTVLEFLPGELKAKVHEKIQKLRDAYAESVREFPGLRIYASSVLIGYDGDSILREKENKTKDTEVRLALIDFAHMYLDVEAAGGDNKDPTFDDGVLKGLNSLVSITGE